MWTVCSLFATGLALAPHPSLRTPVRAKVSMADTEQDRQLALDLTETELLRLCALTDRGQRATARQKQQLNFYIESLEAAAPKAEATDLNGEWRLLAAIETGPGASASATAYRSSPFFWAFRQATAKYTTPVGIPSGDVPAGGPIASAVYAITDAIPFYEIGTVVQRFDNVCSDTSGCKLAYDDDASTVVDGATSESVPSEGTDSEASAPKPKSLSGGSSSKTDGTLESEVSILAHHHFLFSAALLLTLACVPACVQVELILGRTFGPFPPAKSYMTTKCTVKESIDAAAADGSVDVDLRVETTAARQSTLAAQFPIFDQLNQFEFPSGDALDALSPRSSTVKLRTSYLSQSIRVSRPVLDLDDTPFEAEQPKAVFVWARD